MKILLLTVILSFVTHQVRAVDKSDFIYEINGIRMTSNQFASFDTLSLLDLESIAHSGFKHVITFSSALMYLQKSHAESLGMSFQQISIDWNKPHNQEFVELMNKLGNKDVYIYSNSALITAKLESMYQQVNLLAQAN